MSTASASCGVCGATFSVTGSWLDGPRKLAGIVSEQLFDHRRVTGHEHEMPRYTVARPARGVSP